MPSCRVKSKYIERPESESLGVEQKAVLSYKRQRKENEEYE